MSGDHSHSMTPSMAPVKFADPLRLPPVWRLTQTDADTFVTLRVSMRPAYIQLHSALPPTQVWAYQGSVPGPTIEVRRGQRVQIEWVNDIPAHAPYPVTAVTAPDPTSDTPPDQIPQNQPGRSGGQVNSVLARVPPWLVVHLHGGRIEAIYDGWTENGILSGQSLLMRYTNDQRAAMLWYHDHAMGITRFNVYAGLFGLYLIRDDEEDALGLPSGPYEIPLLLQDRNLDTDADGQLTGQLLHKVEDSTMEFFGPFTTVNATLWPYAPVEARQYRLRLLNGANARTFRLMLLDDTGQPIPEGIVQIGTDGGLLGAPVALPRDGLVLAPAERADLIVDFRAYRGQRLTLVNTAGAPFDGAAPAQPPGTPDPARRLADASVMQFRVGPEAVDDTFVLPPALSSSYRRLTADLIPAGAVRRIVALVEDAGMLTLRELAAPRASDAATGEPLIAVTDDQGVTTSYRIVARHFEDTVNWFVAYGATEIWQFLNLTEDTHPMHVHLVQFQAVARDHYNTRGFDSARGGTTAPVTFESHGTLDANETGWKDTVRVNPGELLTIAATFDGYTGRYMYHCHLLEHEDHDMMRPFIVMPAAALEAMGMTDGMAM
ncbi:MAG: multicopper oxidase family protein [Ktedonobacterales bacterium]